MMRISLAVLAIAGCQSSSADKEPPAPPSVRFEHDTITRYHMHANLDSLHAIERLLVRNSLDAARILARSIAEAPDEPDLGPWAVQAAEVRKRAAALAAAPGIDEACRREARVAAACAGCHVDTRVQPAFKSSAPPADEPTIEARMARHRWATARLWEGVVGGADEPWRAGLDVLAATPLPFRAFNSERAGLAKELQRLAAQAKQQMAGDSIDERARRYGEMLVTCAACHASPEP